MLKKDKRVLRILGTIVLSLMLTCLVVPLFSPKMKVIMRDVITENKEDSWTTQEFFPKEIESANYLIDGKRYTSISNDPQLIFNNIDVEIENIGIVFANPTESKMVL